MTGKIRTTKTANTRSSAWAVVVSFIFTASTAVSMVPPASPAGGPPLKRSHPQRIVLRLKTETATGLANEETRSSRSQWNSLPKELKKSHARWGVESLSRVGPGRTPRGTPRKAAARIPKDGAARAADLRAQFHRTVVLELAPNADVSQAIRDYRSNPDVEWAESARQMEVQGIPNDPSFSSLWGMTKIQAPGAWDLAGGGGVVVAVIDTGVDQTHPDLAANSWTNSGEIPGNGVDDDGNGYVDDANGWNFVSNTNSPLDGHNHGTHVAGTVAAVGNNGLGVIGVAPAAKIMAVKGLGDDGSGYDSDLAQAIVYAADNGADVINMSWGGTGDSPLLEEAIGYAYSLGVVLVAAAGNSAIDASQFLPAKYTSVITVSAFNSSDVMASFSNYGTKIDVAAPGVGILSTLPGGAYASYSGTSMACPHVAGLAALLLSRHPDLTGEQVRQLLRRTADDVDVAGVDPHAGYGRINALKALQAGTPVHLVVTSPSQFAAVGSGIDVRGSVEGAAVETRRLEYGSGESPATFLPIGNPSAGQVSNGSLGVWDSAALAEGRYTLRLVVTEQGGIVDFFTVSPIQVDHTGPSVPSFSPADGATVPVAPVSIAASATDEHGISRLEFRVDGNVLSSTAPSEPSSTHEATFVWTPSGVGPHTIQVSAVDSAGNETVRSHHVTVVNDAAPPMVSLTAPAANSEIAGTVAVQAAASDNVGVLEVRFSVDGAPPFATDAAPPYRATLSTVHLSLGTHTLTATAVDTSLQSASQSVPVTVVPDNAAPAISEVNATVLSNGVRIQWTTDEPSDSQVEYGASETLDSASSLDPALTTAHAVDVGSLPPETIYVFRVLSRDEAGNVGISSTGTFKSSDDVPPVGGISHPAPGDTVSGTVLVSGWSTDENTVSRVDLMVDGHYWSTVFGPPPPAASISGQRDQETSPEPVRTPQTQTAAWTYSLDTTQLSDGPHTLTARSIDGAELSRDSPCSLTIHNGSRIAQFDPVLGAPLCSQPGEVCASGGLLEARSTLDQFPEPHHPNTVFGGCNDGASGRYHSDESNDWIRLTSLDGHPLKAGKPARVDVKVWAYSAKNNYLDLFITSDTIHPAWRYLETLQPDAPRASVLSSTITLPSGGETQAVRAVFRYQGNAGACSDGDYDDHDDLVFAVDRAEVLPPTESDQLVLGDFYSIPHPITAGIATLRVEVQNAERVSQKIYSLTGQLILENPSVHVVESRNGWQAVETSWSTDDVAAGTYYWMVEADGGSQTVRNVRKLAVVK